MKNHFFSLGSSNKRPASSHKKPAAGVIHLRRQPALYGDEQTIDVVDKARPRPTSSTGAADTDDSGVSSRSNYILPVLPPGPAGSGGGGGSLKLPWSKVYKASVIPPAKRLGSGFSTGSSGSPISDTGRKPFEVAMFSPDPDASPDGDGSRTTARDDFVEEIIAKLNRAQQERDRYASDYQR